VVVQVNQFLELYGIPPEYIKGCERADNTDGVVSCAVAFEFPETFHETFQMPVKLPSDEELFEIIESRYCTGFKHLAEEFHKLYAPLIMDCLSTVRRYPTDTEVRSYREQNLHRVRDENGVLEDMHENTVRMKLRRIIDHIKLHGGK